MRTVAALVSLWLGACAAAPRCDATWPQGSGPNGNWTASGPAPPLTFSGTTGENVVWRMSLPETGQGGIALANGRVFVATMAPWTGATLAAEDAAKYAHATEGRAVVGKHVDAHCLDAATGALLWTRRIDGEVPSIYSYPFSDATSASPCADDAHVWFTNAGGQVVCFTHAGDVVWSRRFTPTFDGPFNKQFEPFLLDDPARGAGARTFVHMEPFAVGGAADGPRWNVLLGLDAATGAELWRSDDALTHYNAPILVATADGPCVLHARGGPHDVPERPVGLSLTRATGPRAGSVVWRYEDPRGNHEAALQTMACDARFAYWLLREPLSLLVVLDVRTGAVVREISLLDNVVLQALPADDAAPANGPVTLQQGVFPARYSMHAAHGRLWFLTYATAWGKPVLGAPRCVASVDPMAAPGVPAVRYAELPTRISCEHGERRVVWRTSLEARAIDSRGDEVTGDPRSRWDGWDWVFHPSPTQVGDLLFFTLQTGLVYVIDAAASSPVQSDGAPAGFGDLGPLGATWTGNSVSYADGRLYHRTARELLCFGRGAAR